LHEELKLCFFEQIIFVSTVILNFVSKTMGKIEIDGMYFYAWHGHFDVEQLVGNDFLVDVSLETDCSMAAVTDNLDDALNYQAVYDVVKKEMMEKSRLLENVVKRILDALEAQFPVIQKAKVKVSKVNPAMGGQIQKVSVTMERKK
jgi:7,8-dihydroneopterin aldolase/epimerase/oxygenase